LSLATTITTQGGETTVSNSAERQGDLIADRRLYLNAAGQPVEAGDASRTELLAAAGTPIRKERAEKLGLRMEQGRLAWGQPEKQFVRQMSQEEVASNVKQILAHDPAPTAQEPQEMASGDAGDTQDPKPKNQAASKAKRNG
jgi:hypothetical protein